MKKSAKATENRTQRHDLSMSSEAREAQMIAAAEKLAYQQLMDGTASSQVITHYLKLGSSKDKIEREILEKQKDLLVAKTKAYESAENTEKLYTEAIKAMGIYSGANPNGE